MEKALLTLEEFCQYLGIGKTKGRELLTKTNNTFTVRIGNRLYANKLLLDKWLMLNSGNHVETRKRGRYRVGKDLNGKELGKGIHQRKDGRYEARAKVNGVQIDLLGKNLQKLKKKFAEEKALADNRLGLRRIGLTLNEWFEEWFETYKRPYIKESSVFPMKNKFRNTFGKHLGNRALIDITNIDVQHVINEMREEGRAASSMRDALGRMRDCMEAAKHNMLIPNNPCFSIRVPWDNKQIRRRFLSKEEQKIFLKAAENNWYKEMFYIMFLSGMRIGEVGGLKWSDIDFKQKRINIKRSLSC